MLRANQTDLAGWRKTKCGTSEKPALFSSSQHACDSEVASNKRGTVQNCRGAQWPVELPEAFPKPRASHHDWLFRMAFAMSLFQAWGQRYQLVNRSKAWVCLFLFLNEARS